MEMEPLTNYELVFLFKEVTRLASDFFMTYISIVVGFLAIGLFFGQTLPRSLTAIVVGLYSVISLSTVLSVMGEFQAMGSLALQIRARAAQGADIEWLPINSAPSWVLESLPVYFGLVLAVVFICSIFFFFRVQHLDPKDFR